MSDKELLNYYKQLVDSQKQMIDVLMALNESLKKQVTAQTMPTVTYSSTGSLGENYGVGARQSDI